MGRATHGAFWSADLGGYNLEAGVAQVFTSYGAWTSLGHLALYAADHQTEWLDMVRSNADALATQAATGDLRDVHDYMIASNEASLATEMVVAIKNQAVNAFNEIMRMQV